MEEEYEIVAGDSHVHPVMDQADTHDIIKTIMDADKCGPRYVMAEAQKLLGDSIYETVQNTYTFIRENIPYVEDPEGLQAVQSPGELWNNRYSSKGGTGKGGDCKSMAIFCAAILKLLGIDFKYRFISEVPDADLYHVYLIVRDDDGTGYITLDCTLKQFDRELNVAKIMDVDPAPADAPCPFPAPASIGSTYIFNTTLDAGQNSGDMWAAHETAYANSEMNPGAVKQEMIDQIRQHFGANTQKGRAVVAFVNDEWQNFLKSSALMIYHYWGDTTLEMGDFAGKPIPELSEVDIRIGATEINVKQQLGTDFWDDLVTGMGVSQATVKKLVQLSCYNNHGVTMSYMLYRCYNKLTYGQEWGTIPGVPYYDANTKTVYPNGARFEDFIALAWAFPLEGGTGKPWGLPYISRGIFIMTNGASDAAIQALTDQIQRLGWNGYINSFIFPGGTEDYEGKSLSDADALRATTIYYNWLNGNLPVLYSNTVLATLVTLPGGGQSTDVSIVLAGPRIGEITTAVATLIAAIVAAVVSLATALIGFFLAKIKSKQSQMQAHPAIAPADFKMQYQTADGCYIGSTADCPSGYGKLCRGEFHCVTNLQLPENSPVNNNNVPDGTGPNLKLWGGIALAGAGLLMLTSDDEKK